MKKALVVNVYIQTHYVIISYLYNLCVIGQRNDTTRRIEAQVLRLCKWENPVRSAIVLAGLIGSITLTQRYSLLQIITGTLTIAISVNFLYVFGTQFTQTVISDRPSTHPWSDVLNNQDTDLLNKDSAVHYSSIVVDVAETVARAVTRIVLIEDMKTSLKWLAIFFTTWRISAYVPSRVLISIFVVSAFVFPRLYISNKDLIDARLQQGQAILNSQLQRTQEFANSKLSAAKEATKTYVDKTKSVVESKTNASLSTSTASAVPAQKLD
ncbi:Reticulon-domain-containing protein [Parasitella parasitica]|nr:Reticulon-domain-containing protein [Parasitella parasitica]